MKTFAKYAVAGLTMGLLDFAWLGFIAKQLYQDELGGLLLSQFNMLPAVLFYVLYVVGTIVFIVNPALEKMSLRHAVSRGALFGLVAYGTYDLTSLAVIDGFSVKVVVIDLMWGAFITMAVAAVTYLVAKRLSTAKMVL